MDSNSPPSLGPEMYWFHLREFLHHQGYRLRSKFDPDFASKYHLLDETAQEESQVLYFDPEDSDKQIMVMLQLVTFKRPVFETVGEVIACWKEIFEGIQYMHENLVAHRDCPVNNIMQDPALLYPDGFHPVQTWMDPSYKHFARHITRTDQRPPTEEIICGGDKSPPEHLGAAYDIPCNPFQTDIYFLGNLLKRQFMYKAFPLSTHIRLRLYGPLSFLDPLIEDMTQRDPALRPTIGEVIERFDEITRKLGSWHLRRHGQQFILPP
ncbi:kinase domain-containing protein [Favolaschia claudopus]|uniref:Kinase domain-containing protein n=1 Tax=Favolaschia claudopus TaxID=2862362 RepID=A0AAW0AI44_9AGAR